MDGRYEFQYKYTEAIATFFLYKTLWFIICLESGRQAFQLYKISFILSNSLLCKLESAYFNISTCFIHQQWVVCLHGQRKEIFNAL